MYMHKTYVGINMYMSPLTFYVYCIPIYFHLFIDFWVIYIYKHLHFRYKNMDMDMNISSVYIYICI